MKRFISFVLCGLVLPLVVAAQGPATASHSASVELWRQVEVIRTSFGVPHIRAQNFRAAGYALGWLQCEDYGTVTPMSILSASGRSATVGGYDRVETDLIYIQARNRALPNYSRLPRDVQDIYDGFAAGINRYVSLNRDKFPPNMPSDFTGKDVLATELILPPVRKYRPFINRVSPPPPTPGATPAATPGNDEGEVDPDEGSNAWAFAPSRTKSGKAILLRNPHLQWTAGYYEAHMTVPGKIDFYGDFRIGSAFAVIGGFNRYLGWSTTNNSQDIDEFYALDVDPKTPDHYLLDGRSYPLQRELITANYRNGDGLSSETREYWSTPFGRVVHRANGKIYIVKFACDGEYRAGEQFLKMMRSKSLDEWKAAMKMRARPTSNFTYADGAGNIFFLWNASLPLLPHPVGEDLDPKPVRRTTDMWSKYVPFEQLPQFLNPPGGYIHNENNSPHFTNVKNGINLKDPYPNFEEPELSLRGQLGLQLVSGEEKLSLEDVVRLKHNYRALLADRVKADLVAAVRGSNPSGDVAAALELLEKWNNTTAPETTGSVPFELWWQHYSGIRPPERNILPDNKRYARVWDPKDPLNTPSGLADKQRAVDSFTWAVQETKRRYGRIDVTWGDVHRVRRGNVDVPVGGCGNDLGCFRVLGFRRDADGKLAAISGDGWVLAVEFDQTPRAYSVLAYGESSDPKSQWYSDQAALFARGELKKVAFTEADVNAQSLVRYRPGEK